MQQTMSKFRILLLSVCLCLVLLFFSAESFSDHNDGDPSFDESLFSSPLLVKRDQRTPIVATEFGEISTVQIGDRYHLQFITLEPNALLLPLILHSDMVLFVHTGSGILNWVEEEKERKLELRQGDVYRLRSGTVFHLHSSQVPEKLRIYAIFNVEKCLYDPCLGAYSNIRDVLLGFDERTLRSAFAVPQEVLEKIRDAKKPPLITNALPRSRTQGTSDDKWQVRLAKLFGRVEDVTDHLAMEPIDNSKKKKSRAYNVFEADPDFENVNGRSIVVDEKDMDALKGSSFGVFMVNLTKGSMMGPHWNPSACEISIVLRGKGMIRVVNQQLLSSCKNKSERFMVEEGDVFVVPKFHPMAQMSFENSSFIFMGFSTSVKTNNPQFLVGKSSVLKVLDREVLATSFNLSNETIKRLLKAQKGSVMFECVSCAEGELAKLIREIEKRRRREEEEIERRRKEEEEARMREEERKREEEEAKRREEEKRRREEEETERRRKEEEEARKREEERKRGEEEAKRREEERKRREEEEEEARKREEEREREEERRRREEQEKEARKREEEREKEEEMAKKREEERKRREKEEEEARKREEEREKEEEMAKSREEERQRKDRAEVERKKREEQERKKREEERKREEEAAEREEEERRRREEEEDKRRWPPLPQPHTIAEDADDA